MAVEGFIVDVPGHEVFCLMVGVSQLLSATRINEDN